MKRLWMALALLVMTVALCWVSGVYQRRQTDTLLAQLDRLEATYRRQDMEESRRLARELATELPGRTKWFLCFMSHDELAAPRETAAVLVACLEEENPEEFLLETARLRQQLRRLQEVDNLRWENVL